MNEEEQKQYIKNITIINKLLIENEEIIKKAGYKPPVNNFTVEKTKRIKIPRGYIRTSAEFWNLYHLDKIVTDKNTRNNISYALQLSDYYNFFINRINIWGSIEIMMFKQAFVNLVSIIEALVLECANNINAHCKECREIGRCKNNIAKYERENAKSAIGKLYSIGVLQQMTEADKERLIKLFDLRNKIHIRLTVQNEFLNQEFNLQLYNETIRFLQMIDNIIFINGVPLYTRCIGFEEK